jgi:hypothetical protein
MGLNEKRLLRLVAAALMLAACGGSVPAPGPLVEQYLQARVKGDANTMIALSCAAWEPQARLEADSIRSRAPQLSGLSCAVQGSEGNATFVGCSGKIITNYQGESREVNLAERPFKLVDGRMCGYR